MSIIQNPKWDEDSYETSLDNCNHQDSIVPKAIPKLDGFRGFVEAMVEEIVLEEKPFDSYKEELKKHCEEEGVDFNSLEYDLEDFLEDLNVGIKSPDCLAVAMGMGFAFRDAEKCYVRNEKIEEIAYTWNLRHN